jgi:hypothetical protein
MSLLLNLSYNPARPRLSDMVYSARPANGPIKVTHSAWQRAGLNAAKSPTRA